ncbi:MAG: hypothetical protein WDO73_15795 [Ignavibacteriota bacterium]
MVLDRLVKVVRQDWEHSRALDLSDEGLLEDLESHAKHGGMSLADSATASASE